MSRDPETVRRLLEDDLIEWADDTSLRLVWADLLQLEGDPLGQLVVLDHAAATARAAVAERARAEADLLRRRLAARLWDEAVPDNPGVTLRWQLGFVRELEVRASKLSTANTPAPTHWRRRLRAKFKPTRLDTINWIVPLLMRQPALRWVEVVRVELESDHDIGAWSQWLTHGRLTNPTLREIHIGRPARLCERPSGAWEPGSIGGRRSTANVALIESFRRLRWLSLGGQMIRLPCREGSPQTRLHHVRGLAKRPLTSPNRASLARALWDASVLVHQAAFETARALGPEAEFLLDDLIWFLRPPIGKKDPRQAEALRTLATIGPASASLLPEVVAAAEPLVTHHGRLEALMQWLAALGGAATPALALVEAVLEQPAKALPKSLRVAAKRAHKAICG
ncbi:hypothetical protein ENSA5_65720 [Enhygromyxa salina]|uniref:Uncharacterized protein n=1 Tax=Enhygromyxa salina TaxID=215803 RepID=A0A2S9XBU5_9BACT|nr:hypothetical protein [Enhygromyxa salina]PRP90325.1 hypothetical protein ENSA5_65720 [Enhygromyxa salina]